MVASPRLLSRATNTIRAPIFASRCAATSPMPEVPPVITTTLPLIYYLLLRQTVVKRQTQQPIYRGPAPKNLVRAEGLEFRSGSGVRFNDFIHSGIELRDCQRLL